MGKAQILIKAGEKYFEFSKSRTGQLDYVGIMEGKNLPETDRFQEMTSSTYFSPSRYTFLQDNLNNSPKIYVSSDTDVSDKDIFAYLTHIGALLAAVEAKDSLLAGELYLRRRETFDTFTVLTQYIIEPICVEILFSLCFGKLGNNSVEEIPLVFNIAKKKLGLDSSRETLEQSFLKYFKNNSVTLTLAVVGNNFHTWKADSRIMNKITDNLTYIDILENTGKIREAKNKFYGSLQTSVQAEPYNEYDSNAIAVNIENINAKIAGNPGMERAGFIRALAAKVIREAKPERMSFNGKLVRLSSDDIVVQVTI